jgi:hypothetical protein
MPPYKAQADADQDDDTRINIYHWTIGKLAPSGFTA